MKYSPRLDCDSCFDADDYRRGDHGAPVQVHVTQTMQYEDGSSAPYSDSALWCPCCITLFSSFDDMIVTVVSPEV